nr:MAG TPA: hypothetical protein [Caudoviricetes sp.]
MRAVEAIVENTLIHKQIWGITIRASERIV